MLVLNCFHSLPIRVAQTEHTEVADEHPEVVHMHRGDNLMDEEDTVGNLEAVGKRQVGSLLLVEVDSHREDRHQVVEAGIRLVAVADNLVVVDSLDIQDVVDNQLEDNQPVDTQLVADIQKVDIPVVLEVDTSPVEDIPPAAEADVVNWVCSLPQPQLSYSLLVVVVVAASAAVAFGWHDSLRPRRRPTRQQDLAFGLRTWPITLVSKLFLKFRLQSVETG